MTSKERREAGRRAIREDCERRGIPPDVTELILRQYDREQDGLAEADRRAQESFGEDD
jgi:SOS response regulatory protein OraA/RecX